MYEKRKEGEIFQFSSIGVPVLWQTEQTIFEQIDSKKIEAETHKEEEIISSTMTESPRKSYELFIVNHPNYEFLPKEQKQNWVCVSKKGENPRKQYWDSKQKELMDTGKIPRESTPKNVAVYLHPTKKHVCGKCGTECSIYYVYPTVNTWKWLKKTFDYEKKEDNKFITIFEIYSSLAVPNKNILFEKYFGVSISELENQCKSDTYSGAKLSPGVFSNAPDRLDGFHCYNSICGCRSAHDKGRSTENMKSYTRDRRAYEYFSDGKCLLANCLMGKLNTITSNCFICGKTNLMTADHIGPISLGFIHDPVNFQACCRMCNSSKNNRITVEDVAKIKSIEEKGTSVVSWWAKDSWEMNKNKSIGTLKGNLDKNTKKFLSIVLWLKNNKLDVLESFITEIYMDHDKSYNISDVEVSPSGDVKFKYTESETGKKTKEKQKDRTKQILMELNEKNNRKIKIELSEKETSYLSNITFDNFKSSICKVLVGL